MTEQLGTCYQCDGRGWVRNGDIEDGMMTGRDDCPVCNGTGKVSLADFELHQARERARFFTHDYVPDGVGQWRTCKVCGRGANASVHNYRLRD